MYRLVARPRQKISASSIPSGYLRTSRFTAPSIKTDGQRNALEALEVAISEKYDQFQSFCDRQFILTSDTSWSGQIWEYESGVYYIRLDGTRCNFCAYVKDGQAIRKKQEYLSDPVGYYDVMGSAGTVHYMSKLR